MHGVQWSPLMQAIADHHPPPTLRITATDTNLDILHGTGDCLSKFAHSLGLRFRFFPLLLPTNVIATAVIKPIEDAKMISVMVGLLSSHEGDKVYMVLVRRDREPRFNSGYDFEVVLEEVTTSGERTDGRGVFDVVPHLL
ncbi:hypothetical protein L6452_01835 [Arctium lappa]|uniref:Uncharacterized protein n=1 Tax=Arctium lappa TaxID=4217 RepID=A0ACB9FH73_ARCLA|nr:hypothetical protein L6452_01835 [Arctium lappa]